MSCAEEGRDLGMEQLKRGYIHEVKGWRSTERGGLKSLQQVVLGEVEIVIRLRVPEIKAASMESDRDVADGAQQMMLIHPAFDCLPDEERERLHTQLHRVLRGEP